MQRQCDLDEIARLYWPATLKIVQFRSRVAEYGRYDITDEVRLSSLAEQIFEAIHKRRRLT